MLSDILWSLIIGCFVIFGFKRPYIALCGVVWIDILKPQNISYGLLVGQPISLMMACVFLISCVINISTISVPRNIFPIFLLVFFLCWITITTEYALFQEAAWFKHDIAYKTILITLFFPFVLDSRVKVEAFLATIIAAVSYYMIIGGSRTLLGQAQYGASLVGTRSGNSGMSETSTLAMVSVMMIPLIYYLYKTSKLVGKVTYFKPIFISLMILCGLTSFGTYARTGLVGLAILAILVVISSRNKLRLIILGISGLCLMLIFMPQDWKDRMSTIQNPEQEASALGRIVVWKWTLDFVNDHPVLGGGFNSYLANEGELNKYTEGLIEFNRAKAFHNIYIEVLGEHGYIGLVCFVMILLTCYTMNRQIYMSNKSPPWLFSLSKLMNISLLIYCVCGNFIAVAFTEWPYYYISLAISLQNCRQKI